MLEQLGAEFEILRNLPLEDIRQVSGGRIAEGIRRLRSGEVERIPGFDGEYGIIRLFCEDELHNMEGQMDFLTCLAVWPLRGGKQIKRKTPEKPNLSGKRKYRENQRRGSNGKQRTE